LLKPWFVGAMEAEQRTGRSERRLSRQLLPYGDQCLIGRDAP
jgi:hypothetical protein